MKSLNQQSNSMKQFNITYRRTNEVIKNRYHFMVIASNLTEAVINFKKRLTYNNKVSIQSVKQV